MEHRCTNRKPLMLDVVIGYNAIGLVHGRTRDIGLGGMFVETGRVELPVNAMVQAALVLDQNGRKQTYKARAMVVHSQTLGAGLMFSNLDDTLYNTLRAMLLSQPCEEAKGIVPPSPLLS